MDFKLKRIHHLIRYFFLTGILIFFGYLQSWSEKIFLPLIGPILYLANILKSLIDASLGRLPFMEEYKYYVYVLPLTVIYFSLMGFLLKQLWNERGPARFISTTALIAFAVFIHYLAAKNLSLYFAPPLPR